MQIIYPRFPNHTLLTSKFIKNIDDERLLMEIDSEREVQIDSYEEECGIYILVLKEYDEFDKPILIHEGFDPISNFQEIDGMFYFDVGAYEYEYPKYGEPIFYKTV